MLIKIRIERQRKKKKKRKNAAPSSSKIYIDVTAHNIVPRGCSLRLHDIENIKWAFTMLEEFRNYGQVRWARRVFRQRCLRGTREENRYEGHVHVISRRKSFFFLLFSLFFNHIVDQSMLKASIHRSPLFFSLPIDFSPPLL